MLDRSRKRPRTSNELAKFVVDIVANRQHDSLSADAAKEAASLLGRLGGLKGGPARAEKLSAKRRSQIAYKAAAARWRKHDD